MSKQHRLTEYGIRIKTELMLRGKTQEWLIAEIKKLLPDKYVDSSNLWKILHGKLNSIEIINAINEILNIKPET